MKQNWYRYLQPFLRYWMLLIVLFTTTRCCFYWNNIESFNEVGIVEFLAGVWFDIIMLSLWFVPLWFAWLLPLPIKHHTVYVLVLKGLAYLCFIPAIALNLVDVAYYKFIIKRSSKELFSFFTTGNDFNQLAGTFAIDFWWLIVLFVVYIVVHEWAFRKWIQPLLYKSYSWVVQGIWLIIIIPIIVVLGRGGFQLKPVSPLDATNFTSSSNASLVLNTPFVVLKSFGKDALVLKEYHSLAILDQLYQPRRQSHALGMLPDSTNVVLFILEGFGVEFIGKYGFTEKTYTPYLDSLLSNALYYEYAYANGRTSIESVPSILASIPSWMSTTYINSAYEDNQIIGLPSILKKAGYSSAFFHGATNGSMRFDVFAKQLGFEKYFGRKEYNNEAHTDGTWGILDEYFNTWAADQLTHLRQPFFATIFTLSSHHPYFVPAHFRDKIEGSDQPIAASIKYADYALNAFFEQAKQQPWFNNTLFVFCADHTPGTATDSFYNYNLVYRIPIAYYHPKIALGNKQVHAISQQINIMPTLLDLLNVETPYYSFGISDFDTTAVKYAFTYADGTYLYFRDKYLVTYRNDAIDKIFDKSVYREIPILKEQLSQDTLQQYQQHIEAIIQRYNHDLKKNHTIWPISNQ